MLTAGAPPPLCCALRALALSQNSSVMQKDYSCRPLIFHSRGANVGEPEMFPAPAMSQKKAQAKSGASQARPRNGSRS